jgi:hypothetical protein
LHGIESQNGIDGTRRTEGIADPKIVPDDPSFTGAEHNDVVSGSHTGDDSASFGRISF